jgi:ABC-2 type transport system permease protein
MVRDRLLEDQPADVVRRFKEGNILVIRSVDGERQYTEQDRLKLFAPLLGLFVFLLAILTTSGYLMGAMTEEKENRTMEVMLTSISAPKMMAGKITGIILIGITQLLFWMGMIFVIISLAENSNNIKQAFNIEPGMAALMTVSLTLAFIMIAAIIATVGSLVTEATEGQQITGPFSVPFVIPYLFTFQIVHNPHSPLALVMSFIPFTAPVTLIMRTSLTVVPTWQIYLSLLIQITSALLLIWLAGRAFRMGMLGFDRRVTWREFISGSA